MPITVTTGAKASNVIVVPRNVRRDGVDEECRKQNIKYLKWTGSKGKGLLVSQIKSNVVLIDYIPNKQDENSDCLLCPKEKCLGGRADAIDHYKRVHISRLIQISNINILMCRCSDIRSRGSDRSIRNRHFHCIACWHPFDTPAKLRIHKLAKHSDKYSEVDLAHLKPKVLRKKKK